MIVLINKWKSTFSGENGETSVNFQLTPAMSELIAERGLLLYVHFKISGELQ